MLGETFHEEANQLEKIIQSRSLKKEDQKTKNILASRTFFSALRKFVKKDVVITKKNQGSYQFEVIQDQKSHFWTLNITEKEGVLRKKRNPAPQVSMRISDDNLINLYQNKYLLKELKIQGRIKFEGDKSYQETLIQMLSDFLSKS